VSTPYIGEIRMFAGNFAPAGWAFCDGSLQPIDENEALFALIGTTYGGDGQTTFALPDLRGRIPIGQGQGPGLSFRFLGEPLGSETVTLPWAQMPAHSHGLFASGSPADSSDPTGRVPAVAGSANLYASAGGASVPMSPAGTVSTGGSQPHDNLMPTLCVSFIISLFGIFPSQS
jgi:microcystin-dependent protein